MTNLNRFLGAFLGLAFIISTQAQQLPAEQRRRTCATPVPSQQWDVWFNQLVETEKMNAFALKGQADSYTIPVIVHVLHAGEQVGSYPNISKAQIQSQIDILNADFSGNGLNVNNVPAAYKPLVADCKITFSMAQLDPNGKVLAEPGIHRFNWHDLGNNANPLDVATSATFQTFFDNNIKSLTIWDPTRYFNIWVSDVAPTNDLLGYASFPAGTGMSGLNFGHGGALDDGVWIWARAFGATGVVHPLYNKGRTATHEIGHWMGLRHIWGDSNCGDDFCNDTPIQQTSNLSCPTYPKVSCSNGPDGDMFMNFMDYCDDVCLLMFTPDQRARMHIAMKFGVFRKELTASSATLCNLPAQPPVASFSSDEEGCMNTFISLQNQSVGLPTPSVSWSIEPNEGFQMSEPDQAANSTLTFTAPGTYNIVLSASNEAGFSSASRTIKINDCGIPASVGERRVAENITLMPNPSSGHLLISGDFVATEELRIGFYNALGAKVAGFSGFVNHDVSYELGHLPDGIYFAVIEYAGRKGIKKLIISH